MMKLLFVLFVSLSLSVVAQNQDCNPMPNFSFNQQKRNVETAVNDAKLTTAIRMAKANCLTVAQTKELADMLATDYEKLELVKASYPTIADKPNFFDLFDCFSSPSTLFRFHYYLQSQNQKPVLPAEITVPQTTVPVRQDTIRQNVIIPIAETPPCAVTTTEADRIIANLRGTSIESNRIRIARQFVQSNCFNSEQTRRILQLMNIESNRLELARFAYDYVTDKNNYYLTVSNLFNFESSKTNLMDYISSKRK